MPSKIEIPIPPGSPFFPQNYTQIGTICKTTTFNKMKDSHDFISMAKDHTPDFYWLLEPKQTLYRSMLWQNILIILMIYNNRRNTMVQNFWCISSSSNWPETGNRSSPHQMIEHSNRWNCSNLRGYRLNCLFLQACRQRRTMITFWHGLHRIPSKAKLSYVLIYMPNIKSMTLDTMDFVGEAMAPARRSLSLVVVVVVPFCRW